MDPYSSPYIIPNSSLHNPFPHSLLRTRQSALEIDVFGFLEYGFWAQGRRGPALHPNLLGVLLMIGWPWALNSRAYGLKAPHRIDPQP